jgi:hypothetical protein
MDSHLTDPLALPIPGTAVDTTNHLLRVTDNNVKLDRYDFSLHGGYGVYIEAGAANTAISNCRFRVGRNNVIPISAEAGVSGISITHCTLNGGGMEASHGPDALWGLINYSGSGRVVVQYNLLQDAPEDAVDLNNGTVTVIVEFNLCERMGLHTGSHPDFVQFVGNITHACRISYNTIYQPVGGKEVTGMEGIQIAAQPGKHPSRLENVWVTHNVILAPGPALTMSCSVAIKQGAGSLINGAQVSENYIDYRGAYYPFYPPTGKHVKFLHNINLRTGEVVLPPASPAAHMKT